MSLKSYMKKLREVDPCICGIAARTEMHQCQACWRCQAGEWTEYHDHEPFKCVGCDQPLSCAPGVGPFCANNLCDRIDDQRLVEKR